MTTRHRRRHTTAKLLFALGLVGLPTLAGAGPAQAINPTYHVTTDVSARSTPTAAPTNVYGIPKGAAFYVNCQIEGEPVGPNGNRLYFWSTYSGRTFYIPDTYTDSPHLAYQPPIAGIPMCGGTPATTTPPASSDGDSVWIGSPFRGTWPGSDGCPASFPSAYCSQPSAHWWLANAPQGDWAADLQNVGVGTAVVLYAAPRDSSVPVTAVVDDVGAACRSGVVGDGGYRVTVGLFVRGTRIGSVTYAHVNPTVSKGQTLNRWGSQIGTVGGGYNRGAGCWTDPHLHFQAYAQSGYSCYNRTWGGGQWMDPSNFLGFVTGRYASGPRQGCP